jgi:hypothetical protein
MKTKKEQINAGHRTIIKRAMRLDQCHISDDITTEQLNSWAIAHPMHMTRAIEGRFESAATAWEKGNNSGSETLLVKYENECELKQKQAESVMRLYGIECDYPGLYPSFNYKGYTYYTVISVMERVLEANTLILRRLTMVKIEINTDNAAFGDAPGWELARILRKQADRFDSGLLGGAKLHDHNGNDCGKVEVVEL